jgi:FAD/FMN-containing dehydrogenase
MAIVLLRNPAWIVFDNRFGGPPSNCRKPVTDRNSGPYDDIVVPRSRVPDYLEAMESLQEELHLPIVCFGHVGDGNMHVNVMIDASDASELERGERAKRRVFELAVEMGGTISGEHGIGIMKSEFLPLALQPDAIAAMKRLKAALDPNNILNPGKIFP